jgi:hypothetical protein
MRPDCGTLSVRREPDPIDFGEAQWFSPTHSLNAGRHR